MNKLFIQRLNHSKIKETRFKAWCGVWILVILGFSKITFAQVNLGTSPYTQNFNGTVLPTGWQTFTGATSSLLGASATPLTTETWANTSGNFRFCASAKSPLTSGSNSTDQSNATDRCLAVRTGTSFGDPGASFNLQLANTTGKTNFSITFSAQLLSAQPRTTTYEVQYGIGVSPTTWTSVGATFTDLGINSGTWGATDITRSFSNALDNQSSTVWIRIVTLTASSGSGSRCTFGIDDVSLTWIAVPSVSSLAATSITTNSAILNGNVTSDGGSTITERGFVYNTLPGVTITNNKTIVNGTTGIFSLTPTLSVNTEYFFKAYATNLVGTTLSTSEFSFYTLANTPTAPTVNNPQSNSLDITIGSSDGNPPITNYAIQEINSGNYVQTDGTLAATAVWQTAATWATKTVTGLAASTGYSFQVKARNGNLTETVFSTSANGTTAATVLASSNLSNTAVVSENITRGNQVIIQQFKIDITVQNATINQISVATSGNYEASNIDYVLNTSGFALWYNTSYSLTGAVQLGSFQNSISTGSGETILFSGFSQTINAGNSGYFLVTANIASSANLGNTINGLAVNNTAIIYSTAVSKTGVALAGGTKTFTDLAPILTADNSANNVDNDIEITFNETANNASFRTGITGITINSSALNSNQYDITQTGKIILKPSVTGNTLLKLAGSKVVVITASYYTTNGTVTQQINYGAATQLTIAQQPAAPSINGAVFSTQPKIEIKDQYGNTNTASSALVLANVGSGTWTIGGSEASGKAAASGVVTYTNLTATSNMAVNGATILFTSAGLTSVTSNAVNIPVPMNNDLCDNATNLTVGASATLGTTVGATYSSPFSAYEDVWYKFTPTCSGFATVKVTTTSQDIDLEVWSANCPNITGGKIGIGGGVTNSNTDSVYNIAVVAGNTYYARVYKNAGTSGNFNITVTNSVAAQFTLANTGSPASGNIAAGNTNAVLLGFSLSPANCNNTFDFTAASISTSGTATSNDVSNFRIIIDENNNGIADVAEVSSPIATVNQLDNMLIFSNIQNQSNLTSIRRYLLIASVATNITVGNTISCSLTSANVTATVQITGSANGNTMTLTNIPVAGDIVINQFNPGYSTAGDEYIELINTTGKTFDLSQLSIAYASASGNSGSAGGVLSGMLQPYSFWLLSTNATITVGTTSSLTRDGSINTGFAGTSGQFALQRVSDNVQIDGVAYGSITSNQVNEGTATAAGTTAPSIGLKRVIDGSDNNTNSIDFTTVANSSIYLRNSSSRLVKTGINVPAATYRDLAVVGSANLSGNVVLTGQLLLSNGATLTLGSNNSLTYASILGSSATNNIAVSASNNINITGSGGTIFFDQTTNTLRNLTINGSGSTTLANALNIAGGSNFGVVTVGNGATLATNGFLTLKSDTFGTASIGNSAGSITGNVTVERFIPAQTDKRYRFLSSPVTTIVADWRGEIFITGGGASTEFTSVGTNNIKSNGLDWTLTGSPSMFGYTENLNSGDLNTRWEAITNASTSLIAGKGYRVFIRGNRSNAGVLDNSITSQSTVTLTSIGTINAGSQSLPVTYNGSTTNDGWNLVGNPYPSAIDWNAASGWTKTNVSGTIWIYKPSTNSYGNWDGTTATNGVSQNISSGQAFFVRTTGAAPALSCTEAVKVNLGGSSIFKTTEDNTLRISLAKNSANSDETVIRFMDNKSDEFNDNDDVRKFVNAEVNISSNFGLDKYAAVNYLNTLSLKSSVVKLSAWVNQNGTYKLKFSGVNSFPSAQHLVLKDKFLNTTTDLRSISEYQFSITDDTKTKDDNRFEIVFTNNSTNIENSLSSSNKTQILVYPNPATDVLNIDINNANFKNSEIVVFNISGAELLKTNMANNNAQLNIETLSAGVYFVKVSNQNGFNKTVKFVK